MRQTRLAILILTIAAALAVACGDRTTIVGTPTSPSFLSAGSPSPSPVPSTLTAIEFRVAGNAASARVRYSTPADGLTQTITGLPFSAGFSTSADAIFLSLEATPVMYSLVTFPFFSVRIVVNDSVFREATSADFSFTTLAVDGTWRR